MANSIIEAKYVVAFEAAKEVVWLKKFLSDLQLIPGVVDPLLFTMTTVGP